MKVCRECNQPYEGSSCECGRKATKQRPYRAQTVDEQLMSVIERWKGPLPKQLPVIPALACMRWVELQEPRKRTETIRHVAVPNSDGQREIDPYVERLRGTLQAFLIADDALRDLVVAGVADKIYWRGDDMHMFARIYEETLRMREMGVDAYRAQARTVARGVIKKMVGAKPAKPLEPEPVASWNDDGAWS